jgi:hypothetical protein
MVEHGALIEIILMHGLSYSTYNNITFHVTHVHFVDYAAVSFCTVLHNQQSERTQMHTEFHSGVDIVPMRSCQQPPVISCDRRETAR